MAEYREEVVETTVEPVPHASRTIEERTVDASGTVQRVVHTTSGVPSAFPAASEAARRAALPRRTIRRWWRTRTPAVRVAGVEDLTYREEAGLAQFLRVAWFLLGLLEAVLGLRFLMALLGANAGNSFAMLIYGVTGPFVAPFRTLFATPSLGDSVFEGYTLVAMLVIFGAWWVGVRFLGILVNRSLDV